MKQLEFLERDYKCIDSDEDIQNAKRHLKYGGIPFDAIEKMIIHYQYHHKEKDDIVKLLFNQDSIKVAHSVYIQGSDSDFMYFMAMAGRNDVKGVTYIDTTGELIEFLNRNLRDEKDVIQIMCGINQNNIISMVYEPKMGFKKLEIHFSGYFEDCVVLKDFDLNLLN